jgi:hypothetical protein
MSLRHRYLLIFLAVGAIGLSSLPYLPIWNGVNLYVPGFQPVLVLLLIAQSVLLVGYVSKSIKPTASQDAIDRFVWVIYPWGILLLPGVLIVIGWFERDVPLSLASVLPGLAVAVLSGIWVLVALQLRKRETLARTIHNAGSFVVRFFSLDWIYRILWGGYFALGRLIHLAINILEGDGGILWALLFVVLLVALLAQVRLGG